MKVEELFDKFVKIKSFEPSSSNDLLDFAKKCYLHNMISVKEYRELVKQLEKDGAHTPEDMIDELV